MPASGSCVSLLSLDTSFLTTCITIPASLQGLDTRDIESNNDCNWTM